MTNPFEPHAHGARVGKAASGCLANATLVLEDRTITGRITWSEGRIASIEEGTGIPDGATDCAGDHILPGLVELHTDNLERHIQPRPGVDWPHDAALLAHDRELSGCGITTVFDALRVGSIGMDPQSSYREYARGLATELAAARRAGILGIDHRLHLRAEICSETLLDELAGFGPEDGVGLLSLMDHTPGQRQFRDLDKLRTYVKGKRDLDEDGFRAYVAQREAMRARHGDAHEAGAVAHARRLGAVLASHDDTTAAQVGASAAHGVSLAEFPTTVEAARACRDHGIPVMMGAPNLMRGASHSGNVSAVALAEAGLLDILSSDYVPAGLLLAAWRLGTLWNDLPRAVATVSRAPALAAGLRDRGALAEGLRADLLRVGLHRGTPTVARVVCNGRLTA